MKERAKTMRKMIVSLFVVALVVALAIPAMAQNQFVKVANMIYFDADEAGEVTFTYKKGSDYVTVTVSVDAGRNDIGEQSEFSGHDFINSPFTFVPDAKPSIDVHFIGYYGENPETGLPMQATAFLVTLNEGETFDWDVIVAGYDNWVDIGGFAPGDEFQSSGYASFVFEWGEAIGFGDFTEGQLETYYGIYCADPGYVLPVVEDPVFASAIVSAFSDNLQDKGNHNLTFTVTVTLSDGSTSPVFHAEKVNGEEKGNKTFDYGDYSVFVKWNDNNWVTKCEVL